MIINKRREALTAACMLAPNLTGLVVFLVIPTIASFGISLTNWNLMGNIKWVGWGNFKDVFGDVLFWQTLKNTSVYVFCKVPLNIIFSLVLAVLLNQALYGRTFFRALIFLPMIASSVSVALLWQPLFLTNGLLNKLLTTVGLPPSTWIYSPKTSMMSVIIVSLWKETGYYMVMFLAGLQSISRTYYEAANIDGANGIQKFFRITVPLISPTTFFVLTISIIGSFQIFDLTTVLTAGGPVNSTNTLIMYVYQAGFRFFRMGYASALSTVLFFIVLVSTIIQNWASKHWVFY
ncbi:MAG: sugar ABC transporter permease [Treponema sp.]|jgi:multiple sugar transport system permease protein|nr:sugar ABC transporter permease [Treponema sp.]